MKKKNIIAIVVAVLILLISLGVCLGLYLKMRPSAGPIKFTGNDSDTDNSDTANKASVFPLVKNASLATQKVKELQQLLNFCLNIAAKTGADDVPDDLMIDGYYGDKTAAAVRYVLKKSNGDTVTKEEFANLQEKYYINAPLY